MEDIMRKVILGTFVSADGVMQGPGGAEEDTENGFKLGGWVPPYWDESVGAAVDELFGREYDLLLGRKTYDIFAAHWPHAEHGEDAELAKVFNRITKYVATSSRAPLTWGPSAALHDPVADVAKLKRETGRDLVIQGSSVLVHSLLAHRLIDEITLLVFPVTLGAGKRIFSADTQGALKLVSSRTTPGGVVISKYLPDGDVKSGLFDLTTRG
jgi:dihydrofolate reductase